MSRNYILLLALPAAIVRADVVSYEGNSFPEVSDQGWERTPFCDPERSIDDGWLAAHVEVGCGGPPGGDKDRYIRSLGDFAGEERFFLEWRMETDGDRSEIPGVSPASMVAGGFFGVTYHFTLASDQVRFQRDAFVVTVFVDIAPDVPHTYRLELYGGDQYVVYVDGQVIDSGIPSARYPSQESDVLAFRAQPWFLPNTTRWDYVRLGTMPIDGSGDYDSDGQVDGEDFYFFEECLLGSGVDAGPGCRFADFDFDTDVDCDDWASFKQAWTAPDAPPVVIPCVPPVPTASTSGTTLLVVILLSTGGIALYRRNACSWGGTCL